MKTVAPELVSILIPAYNAERWVAKAIRSALDQTWPRKEIIVVDDGSTDGTLSTARAFERGTVKVVTQPNQGAPAARNRALDLAQGDYMQWLDADDLLEPHKISRQMWVARGLSDQHVLSCPFGTFFYRAERARFERTALWRNLSPADYFVTRFEHNVFLQTSVWLVSRALTDAAGPWTETDSPDDDGEYFCRIVLKSAGATFVEGARTYYRVGNFAGVNQSRTSQAQTALLRSKMKCIGYLLSIEDSARTRAACIRLLQDSLAYFYPERTDLCDQAYGLAGTLGGTLQRPKLKWKYRPVEWLCGYQAAVKTARLLPRIRTATARRWDEFLLHLTADVA